MHDSQWPDDGKGAEEATARPVARPLQGEFADQLEPKQSASEVVVLEDSPEKLVKSETSCQAKASDMSSAAESKEHRVKELKKKLHELELALQKAEPQPKFFPQTSVVKARYTNRSDHEPLYRFSGC